MYNAFGQLIHSYSRGSMHHEYTYDCLGRVTRQTTPLSGDVKSITEYEYDGIGNVTEQRISNNPDNSSTVTFRLTFIGTTTAATEHSKMGTE